MKTALLLLFVCLLSAPCAGQDDTGVEAAAPRVQPAVASDAAPAEDASGAAAALAPGSDAAKDPSVSVQESGASTATLAMVESCSASLAMGHLMQEASLVAGARKCIQGGSKPSIRPTWPSDEDVKALKSRQTMEHTVHQQRQVVADSTLLMQDGLDIQNKLGDGPEAKAEAERTAGVRNTVLKAIQEAGDKILKDDASLMELTLKEAQKSQDEGSRKLAKVIIDASSLFVEKAFQLIYTDLLGDETVGALDSALLPDLAETRKTFYKAAFGAIAQLDKDCALRKEVLDFYNGQAGDYPVGATSGGGKRRRLTLEMDGDNLSHMADLVEQHGGVQGLIDTTRENVDLIKEGFEMGPAGIDSIAMGVGALASLIPGEAGKKIQKVTSTVSKTVKHVKRSVKSTKQAIAIAKKVLAASKNGGAKAGLKTAINLIKTSVSTGAKTAGVAAKGTVLGAKGVAAGAQASGGIAKAGLTLKGGLALKGGVIAGKVASIKSGLIAAKAGIIAGKAALAKAIAAGSIKAAAAAIKGTILATGAAAGPVGWVVTAAVVVVYAVVGLVKLIKKLVKRARMKRKARVETMDARRKREEMFGVKRELNRKEKRDYRKYERTEKRQAKKKARKDARKKRKEGRAGYQKRQARKKGRKERRKKRKERRKSRKESKMATASPGRKKRYEKRKKRKSARKEKKAKKRAAKVERKKKKETARLDKERNKVLSSERAHVEKLVAEGKLSQEDGQKWLELQARQHGLDQPGDAQAAPTQDAPVQDAQAAPVQDAQAAPVQAAPAQAAPVQAAPVQASPVQAAPAQDPMPSVDTTPEAPLVPPQTGVVPGQFIPAQKVLAHQQGPVGIARQAPMSSHQGPSPAQLQAMHYYNQLRSNRLWPNLRHGYVPLPKRS